MDQEDTLVEAAEKAFKRDLPDLLKTNPGEWAVYHGPERIAVAKDPVSIRMEISRQKIPVGELFCEQIMTEVPIIHLRW